MPASYRDRTGFEALNMVNWEDNVCLFFLKKKQLVSQDRNHMSITLAGTKIRIGQVKCSPIAGTVVQVWSLRLSHIPGHEIWIMSWVMNCWQVVIIKGARW